MEEKLLDVGFRRQLIAEIKGNENKERSEQSLRDTDIYAGDIYPYVKQELLDRYETDTVAEMSIVSSINICKKIVDQRGSIYKEAPDRLFFDLNDNQQEAVQNIYKDMMMDSKMMIANRTYELQQKQTHVMLLPKKGKIHLRTLKKHQVNVIVDPNNPEKALGYIISSFDKEQSDLKHDESDNFNQAIGDLNDYDGAKDRHIVWSASYHFVMDGKGKTISEEEINPIAPLIPIIEIAGDKDFEYWKKGGSDLSRFTVEYNAALSDLGDIVRRQGFSQAYLKAPEDLQPPQNMRIGPSYILRLLTDPNNEADVDFGFANPGSDLAGAQSYVESLLSQFLSSQGIDPKTITGNASNAQSFSSGIERLLELTTRFEASKDSMAIFEGGEKEIYDVVVAWHNALKDTELLDQKYKSQQITDSTMAIKFNRPEASITDQEKLELIEKKLDLGLYSRVDAIIEMYDLDPDQALEKLKKIDEEQFNVKNTRTEPEQPSIDNTDD